MPWVDDSILNNAPPHGYWFKEKIISITSGYLNGLEVRLKPQPAYTHTARAATNTDSALCFSVFLKCPAYLYKCLNASVLNSSDRLGREERPFCPCSKTLLVTGKEYYDVK